MVATARILRRVWQIYVAHVFLFTIFLAEISYVATSFENPLYSEEMGIMDFLKQPDVTIVQALLLRFRPVNMDVLPLYIVLMLFLPLILWLMKWKPDVTLALSVAALCRRPGNSICICRPIRTASGPSIRSPGNCCSCSAPGARWAAPDGCRGFLSSPVTLWISLAYLFAAFCVTLTWYLPQLSHLMPRWLEQWMYPIDKTDLDVLRFAHFLALAAVTVRFLPRDWPGLKSPWLRPLILCGQHSLEIFCLGVFLAFAGHFVLAEVSGGAGAALRCQYFRNPDHVRRGMGDFVVQAFRRQECVAKQRHRRQRRYGGRGLMKSDSGAILGADAAGRSFWPRARARRGCASPQSCEVPGLSARQRKPAAQGRGSRQRRPSAGYSGGRQPVVDHQPTSEAAPIPAGCRPR